MMVHVSYFQVSEKYIIDGFLMFVNVMVSMLKEGIVIENQTVECFGTDYTPWEEGTEMQRRTQKVSKVNFLALKSTRSQLQPTIELGGE